MQPIQLRLTIDEVNVILDSLGDQPYKAVHQLIANIHQQAQLQLQQEEEQKQEPPLASNSPETSGGE